ncbi:hypothetical protein Tco_1405244 [Tanacetum coccineum]
MRASAKELYWKIPLCYDDDDDYTIAITPVLPTKEPVNSLSMGDEHLDTIPATELDEVIKSSVENLVPIPMMPDGKSDRSVMSRIFEASRAICPVDHKSFKSSASFGKSDILI